ncbi:acetyl-CoA carboxylase biotin carboxyl carrier protein [Paenalkalicoccus suaedae]|uniref:Biotin carboxyl carrier protein of acetyl-CoA carboxylase n=1 Tax=Paenalkalicoccus suaedae TaxID=2592382 RepID=A0A859FDJ7_9BACI|nr:acetyl-CoA carboxylase biotin carboxyl carrier protein [Paenalkalicoccus suaedae]QKS70960.1 acetyl-CoA carboxylase biotin carboxyl carrier protein [Paenalkalicoccus suaedae]
MLKIQEIRELIKLIDDSSIDEFKYEQNGAKITMRKGGVTQVVHPEPKVVTAKPAEQTQVEAPVATKQAQAQPEVTSKPDTSGLHAIKSPMVGTFYQSPSPDADPYVETGSKVKKDAVVCIVEAMKLMNEIEAEVSGEIVEVLVENGQLVEYGQELFLVKPE